MYSLPLRTKKGCGDMLREIVSFLLERPEYTYETTAMGMVLMNKQYLLISIGIFVGVINMLRALAEELMSR